MIMSACEREEWQMDMFGPPVRRDALENGRRTRRADDRPSPGERELLWPSDLVRHLGVDLLDRLYGDLPLRTRLRVDEVCRRIRCSDQHIRNLVNALSLDAIDISVPDAGVPCWRIYRYSLVRWFFKREFGPQAEGARQDITESDRQKCERAAEEIFG